MSIIVPSGKEIYLKKWPLTKEKTMKEGKKTSEFWVTLLFNVFGLGVVTGVLPTNVPVDTGQIITAMGLSSGLYAGARGLAKRNGGGGTST